MPLGKARFVVSIGGLLASSTANWVRTRANTEFRASGCPSRDCVVQTAGGYHSTGASQTLTGTYTVAGDRLRVTWNGGQSEDWTLGSQAGGALAGLTYAGSNFGATHGFGYGSNAAWDARASTTQYYVAPANSPSGHRRDTLWGWRTANADGRGEYCYTGNSHVKPMLQIIDDNGAFHGWVGR